MGVSWPSLVPERYDVEELLDDHDAPGPDVARSLRDLRRFNRFLGGRRVWRKLLRLSAGSEPPRSILEIGTGSSDLLESVRSIPLRVGLDINIVHLLYGRKLGDRSIARVVGDARHLPFRDATIDIAGSSHFFHHFSLHENESILRESLRVSTRGVFVTDTTRSYIPWLFVKLLGALGVVGRITKFDAPASVMRGYTHVEVREFTRRFDGLVRITRRFVPFRFGLIVRKAEPSDG